MPLPALAVAGISAAAGMLPSLVSLISEAANAPNEAEKRKAALEAENLYRNMLMEAQATGQNPVVVQEQIARHLAENMPQEQDGEDGDGGFGMGDALLLGAAAIPGVGALRGGLGAAKAAMAAGRAAGGVKGFAKGSKDAYMALVKQAFKGRAKPTLDPVRQEMPIPTGGPAPSFKSLAGRGDDAEVEKIMEKLRQRRRQATPEDELKWLYGEGD